MRAASVKERSGAGGDGSPRPPSAGPATASRNRAARRTFGCARAKRIARTETVGALNDGRYVGAARAGMQSQKWIHQRVGQSRAWHRDSYEPAGWVPMDYLYGGKMRMPGDRAGGAREVVNCRCAMIYDDRTPDEIAEDEGKAAVHDFARKAPDVLESIAARLATPQPAPVVNVTVPEPPKAAPSRIVFDRDERGAVIGARKVED